MNVLCVTSGGSCSRKINNKHSRKNVIYAANRLQQFNGKQTIDNIRIFYGKSAPIRERHAVPSHTEQLVRFCSAVIFN